MEVSFIKNAIRLTVNLATAISLILLHRLAYKESISLYVGVAAGGLNLFLLKILFKNFFGGKSESLFKVGLLISLKIPLFYLLGYQLLTNPYLESLYVVAGFSLIFIGIFLHGLRPFLFPKRLA